MTEAIQPPPRDWQAEAEHEAIWSLAWGTGRDCGPDRAGRYRVSGNAMEVASDLWANAQDWGDVFGWRETAGALEGAIRYCQAGGRYADAAYLQDALAMAVAHQRRLGGGNGRDG